MVVGDRCGRGQHRVAEVDVDVEGEQALEVRDRVAHDPSGGWQPLDELFGAQLHVVVAGLDVLGDQHLGARQDLLDQRELTDAHLVHGRQPEETEVLVDAGMRQQDPAQRLGLAVAPDHREGLGAQAPDGLVAPHGRRVQPSERR